jgi:hypothetical protein
MKPSTNPYDYLEGLEGDDALKAADLFRVAGQLWMGGGYVFEKISGDMILTWCKVSILNEADEIVATISHPDHFFETVYREDDRRFDRNQTYKLGVHTPSTVLAQLTQLRRALLEDIRTRGRVAATEYALVGEVMGGKPLTAEQLHEALTKALNT